MYSNRAVRGAPRRPPRVVHELDRQVQPAFPRRNVGDVGHPGSVGGWLRELPGQDIGRDRKREARIRGHPVAPASPSGEVVVAHQARHAFAARTVPTIQEFGVNSRTAVALSALGVDRRDLEAEPLVGLSARRGRAAAPGVEPRTGHVERRAHNAWTGKWAFSTAMNANFTRFPWQRRPSLSSETHPFAAGAAGPATSVKPRSRARR
jgi:hypothetical protein